jgi:hypothetical protein
VREIRHHTVERRRSARTLEALSIALGWHAVWSYLHAIDVRLTELGERLDAVDSKLNVVLTHTSRDH